MGEEHFIETHFDVLLSTLKDASKPLSAARIASICGMQEREVVKWLHVLEKSGQVKIENRFNGIHASWLGAAEEKKSAQEVSPTAIDVGRQAAFEADIEVAHQREDDAAGIPVKKKSGTPIAESEVPVSAAVDVADARLERVDRMIGELKARKEESIINAARRRAAESEETVATEISPKAAAFEREPLEESEGAAISAQEIEEEARKLAPDAEVREKWRLEQESEGEDAARESWRGEEKASRGRISFPSKSAIRPKFRHAGAKPVKFEKLKKPAPLEITGVTLQFSERIERQMKRIERQAREIDALRQEKEKLLSDHYIPLQNRLESELETISDRVLHVQSKVAALQKNAADLPAKIGSVEKVQISSIKAHGEMRRAYDEACVLLEESGRQLAEEREKMELILEQSREELSRHSSMSGELHDTMKRIGEMEGAAASSVSAARAALAEQAERLASAEAHANDLRALRGEIGESIGEMKREVASAKRVLSDLERQMGSMRQIEEYANGIRKDYDARMLEIDDYIKNGNTEFETLRESVEASFVRRYLRELRSLTESYSFEFGQARKAEGDIDARIAEERKKLESLFEEGKKISYLFETQSRAPENAGKFEQRMETFTALSDISSNRSQVAQMIAQVIGGRAESLPARTQFSAPNQKASEPSPIGITKIIARSRARKRAAKAARKAKMAKKPKPAAKAPARKALARAPAKKAPARAGKPAAKTPAKKAKRKR
ncbi:MAG: hypothetical protein WC861_04290 [Candidatus Micrarchaeia archaeon]|jgi:hypothetical protein